MFRGIMEKEGKVQTVQSYLGLLEHGNASKLKWQVQKLAIEIVKTSVG
jgi:hypothetical protein